MRMACSKRKRRSEDCFVQNKRKKISKPPPMTWGWINDDVAENIRSFLTLDDVKRLMCVCWYPCRLFGKFKYAFDRCRSPATFTRKLQRLNVREKAVLTSSSVSALRTEDAHAVATRTIGEMNTLAVDLRHLSLLDQNAKKKLLQRAKSAIYMGYSQGRNESKMIINSFRGDFIAEYESRNQTYPRNASGSPIRVFLASLLRTNASWWDWIKVQSLEAMVMSRCFSPDGADPSFPPGLRWLAIDQETTGSTQRLLRYASQQCTRLDVLVIHFVDDWWQHGAGDELTFPSVRHLVVFNKSVGCLRRIHFPNLEVVSTSSNDIARFYTNSHSRLKWDICTTESTSLRRGSHSLQMQPWLVKRMPADIPSALELLKACYGHLLREWQQTRNLFIYD